jgi:hypothetical protein
MSSLDSIDELKWVIRLVRKMPNADDRYDIYCKEAVPKLFDGGSVHRFTLIEKLERRISELEEKE